MAPLGSIHENSNIGIGAAAPNPAGFFRYSTAPPVHGDIGEPTDWRLGMNLPFKKCADLQIK